MSLEPYSPCSCGSGKKFKWCCQPIYDGINRALDLDANGQHDAALKAMEQVTQQHPGNPEAWGQMARLLYVNRKADAAEEAFEKAFAINRMYPYGLLLRALMRHSEGEYQGALILARQATEAYDPAPTDQLGQAWSLIFDCEMRANRLIAGRAALEQALRCMPGEENLRESMDAVFGEQSRRPLCARRKYDLLPAAPDRRSAWNRRLGTATAKLSQMVSAFDALTKEAPTDAAAWHNLGLCRAWLGENKTALEALERYLELEANDQAAATAAALGEVLRCAPGLEEESDHQTHQMTYRFRDAQPIQALIHEWVEAKRLVPLPNEEKVVTALILELSPSGLVTAGRPATDLGRLGGYLLVAGNLFQISSPLKEPFDRLREEVRSRLNLALTDLETRTGPARLGDAVAEALAFPVGPGDAEQQEARILDHAARFFEDTWIHRPRRSLGNVAPVDAVGHAKLRKKVRGTIQFLQDCAADGFIAKYDFDRLRRKLGLLRAAAPAAAGPANVSGLGTAELAALNAESLADEQLEQAHQAAKRLDARDLAEKFARTLVARPAGKADRYPLYAYLIQKALDDGNNDAALDLVNEGEQGDCSHNEGRRRNDYELRRALVHSRRGEAEESAGIFGRLIERTPDDLKVRGRAAEEMLRLQQPARALAFAEGGLTVARQKKDRDSEAHLSELAAAARKKMS